MKTRTNIPKIIVIQETANGPGQEKVRGIFNYARIYGPWNIQLVQGMRGEFVPQTQKEWRSYDGILAGQQFFPYRQHILAAQCPLVLIDPLDSVLAEGSPFARCPHTRDDSEGVGRLAAEYFLRSGCKRFAFVGMHISFNWSQRRGAAFAAALRAKGFSCESFCPSAKKRTMEEDFAALSAWLKTLSPPFALLAANDSRARQVVNLCQELRLSIPENVAVLGVDDDMLLCEGCIPRLSSIRRDTEACGFAAAAMLNRQMERKSWKGQTATYDACRVVERESTDFAILRVPPAIIHIREFIRLNARMPIQVPDILAGLHISRRYAEVQFRAAFGRSIMDEVRNVRVEMVERLLRETRLPITQITAQCGFGTDVQLRRVFRARYGTSMCAYRKQAESGIAFPPAI